MANQYTKCYIHTSGDKPFHKEDLRKLAILYGVAPGLLFGLLTGLVVGLAAGGPIGAVVGLFAGLTIGVALALTEGANQWRYHRLICLSGKRCAIGIVRQEPHISEEGLGDFDNDEFFDLQLMPHPLGTVIDADAGIYEYDYFYDDNADEADPSYHGNCKNYKNNLPGKVFGQNAQNNINKHPQNDIYLDDFQGQALLRPTVTGIKDTEPKKPENDGYNTRKNWLHCEAEGDFWKRISELALALGLLVGLLGTVTAVAATIGAINGAALGCTLGSIFGPIGCLIGGILGAILGALLAGGAVAAVSYLLVMAILQAIFDAAPGEVEDANIGDSSLGPITQGDKVVVYGEHVYDGFHDGWHEIHPLLAIVKLGDKKVNNVKDDTELYLEWQPDFDPTVHKLPTDLSQHYPSAPANILQLTADDMKKGLASPAFKARAVWLRDQWCGLLHDSFDEAVRQTQHGLSERWTIHPLVDGCLPKEEEPEQEIIG